MQNEFLNSRTTELKQSNAILRVSIILFSNNDSELLQKELRRLFMQTDDSFEVIVVSPHELNFEKVFPDDSCEYVRKESLQFLTAAKGKSNQLMQRIFRIARGRFFLVADKHVMLDTSYLKQAADILDANAGVESVLSKLRSVRPLGKKQIETELHITEQDWEYRTPLAPVYRTTTFDKLFYGRKQGADFSEAKEVSHWLWLQACEQAFVWAHISEPLVTQKS